jgi:uncharacterized RDD family membrane protein YckC
LAFCAHCGKELPAGAIVCPFCATPVAGAAAAPQAPSSQPAQSGPVSGFDTLTKDSKAQGYWINRVIAYVIDAVIVFVPLWILTFFIAFSYFFMGGFGFYSFYGFAFGTFTWLWGVLFILYNAFMESSSGASFGKRFMGLKVVGKSGANPNFGDAFIRNLSKIYWLLLILDVIVGLAVSKEYSQKYSDHFLGTKVVSSR